MPDDNELKDVVGDVPAIPAEEPEAAPAEPDAEAAQVDEPPDPESLKSEIAALEKQKKEAEAAALKWRREKAQARKEYFQDRQTPQQPPAAAEEKQSSKPPDPDDYDDYNKYVDALTDYKVETKKAEWDRAEVQKQQDQTHQQKMQALQEKINAGYEKYADFEDVALAETVPITPMVTEVLAETENPADVAYYLGKNQTEAIKISRMTPIAAARAIAQIETKIAGSIPESKSTKKTTGAPAPINPIGGRSAAVSKELGKMTQAEFEAEMERRGAPRY